MNRDESILHLPRCIALLPRLSLALGGLSLLLLCLPLTAAEGLSPWRLCLPLCVLTLVLAIYLHDLGRRYMRDYTDARLVLPKVLQATRSGVMLFRAKRQAQGEITDLTWTMLNPQAQRMLERPDTPLVGRDLLQELPRNRDYGTFDQYCRVIETGQPLQMEHFIDDCDGQRKWLHTHAIPLGDGVLVSVEDVSDRKQAEAFLVEAKAQAEAGAEAKSAFLATMSHEIRTPMNAVIGMTSLLQRTPLSDEQRDYVETIRLSGDNLLTIINDILDYSKIDANQMELETQSFSLSELVGESLELLATKAAEKQLELIAELPSALPDQWEGDPTRLRQVLVNLVSNAVKFTYEGEVRLSVQQAEDERLRFQVCDTGIGIPAERLNRLFQPFSQVDASTTRQFGGTGLGLAICQRLVHMMGGDILVSSTVGEGSCFTFDIALRVQAPTEPPPPAQPRGPLWVVSPHPGLRQHLLAELAACQLSARSAASLAELPSTGPAPALLLLDQRLGPQAHAQVRTRWPQAYRVTLGYHRPEEGEAFLRKPLQRRDLRRALAQARWLDAPQLVQAPSSLPPQEAPAPHHRTLRVLLAEDNPVNQKVAVRVLQRLGIEADVAANGLEVLHALSLTHYDLIFMDMQMPEMDGLEATRQVRTLPHLPQQPHIIAMTANAAREDRQRCLNAGMDDYISKPVKPEDLQNMLYKWFPLASETTPTAQSTS